MQIQEELQVLYDRYVAAYRAKDADGCAAVFTQEAKLLSPYGPVAIGRDHIRDIHKEWLQDEGENKVLTVVEAGSDGEIAWCLARFSEGGGSGGDDDGNGYSLNVFERHAESGWLIRMCSLNDEIT